MRVNFQKKPFDVFIGRPSKWGNPFPIRKDRTREQAVALYEKWIRNKPELLSAIDELELKCVDKFVGIGCILFILLFLQDIQ